jgi:hypothetical protein
MSAGAIRAGEAFVEFSARDDKLRRGLVALESRLRAFGDVVRTIALGTVLAGAAAGLGLLASQVSKAIDVGSQLDDMAAKTGASAQALSELGYAAELSGTNLDAVGTGFKKMQGLLADAKSGSEAATKTLDSLGLTLDELQGKTPDEQLAVFADAIGGIADPADKTAAAMDVFGKSAVDLLPMLKDGAEGLAAMRAEAQRLGVSVSNEDAKALADLGDQFDRLAAVTRGLAVQIGAALTPIVQQLTDVVLPIAAGIVNWVKANKTLVQIIALSLAGIAGLAAAVGGLVIGIFGLWAVMLAAGAAWSFIAGILAMVPALAAAAAGIGVLYLAVRGAISAILGVWSSVGPGIAAAANKYLAGPFRWARQQIGKVLSWLSNRFGWLVTSVRQAGQGIVDALMAGNVQLAAEILWAGLQLVWLAGINEVTQLWNGLTETWQGIVDTLAQAWVIAWTTMEETAISVVEVLSGVWTGLRTAFDFVIKGIQNGISLLLDSIVAITDVIDGVFTAVAQGMAYLVDSDPAKTSADLEASRNKRADQRHAGARARRDGITADQKERDNNTANEAQGMAAWAGQQRAQIQQAGATQLAELQAMQEQARQAREAGRNAEASALKEQMSQLATEIGEKSGKAFAERNQVETNVQPPEAAANPEGTDGDATGGGDAKSSTLGTFSGAVAGMLGGGSKMDRLVRATEKTEKNTRGKSGSGATFKR